MRDTTHSDDRLPDLDPVEAYLDGDLDALATRRFETRLASDPALAMELALARRVRDGLRSLPRRRFPDDVEIAPPRRIAARGSRFRRRGSRRRLADPWRGALAAAALLAIAVFTNLDRFDLRSPADAPTAPVATPTAGSSERLAMTTASMAGTTDAPTPADVEQARKELEIAFAYLGQLGRKAGAGVRELGIPGTGGPS